MEHIPVPKYPQLPPEGYPYAPPLKEEEFSLRDYGKVLRKRRWSVLAALLITLTTTAIFTFAMKPIYRGTTTIQINKESPQIVDFKEIFAINTMDMDYYQTQYKILESRSLAKRVIQANSLFNHPEFSPEKESSPFQIWRSSIVKKGSEWLTFQNEKASPLSEDGKESAQDSLTINEFLDKLKVEPIRNSRLVKVHFDSQDPNLAKQVPNTLAELYIQQNLEARFKATEQAKEWLTRQLDDLKGKVEKADETLRAFGSRHGIISLEEKENIVIQRLSELNEALAKAEAERMAKEALYRQTQSPNSDSLPSILENKLVQELKQTYIQLEAQYMKLSESFFKPDWPEMRRLKDQMETVQSRLNGEIKKIVAGMKNEYESSLRKEILLRNAFEEQKTRAMEMQQRAIQYNILKREADTNKELYKGLLQRMKEAGVSAGITASNIQVVDQAEMPTKPFKPNKRLNLLLAAVVGLFLGVGLAFFLEHLDDTIKTPEDLQNLIRLPSFGIVPEGAYERRRLVDSNHSFPVELATSDYPKSMLSEAYRSIRTSILLSSSGNPPKTIAVSSPNPGEGKTTTVMNTAIVLAQTGARVIIIDADMRKPRIHKVFGKENGVGLSSFLSGNADLEAVVQQSKIPDLYYIPSGPIPPNPSELLGSVLFKKMIEGLGSRFHYLIIDSPPLLAFSDSVIISTNVDGVVMVVIGGKTPRETLKRSKEVLLQVDARILGVVINRARVRGAEYGSYYHRYYYYYGKEDKKKEELPAVTEEKSL
jgi:capsular exopolysaccharide synthesis family protein